MSELTDFGLVVLVVSGTFLAALGAHKLTERVPVPAPALFLLAAAVASEIWPGLSGLSTTDVERIAVVALGRREEAEVVRKGQTFPKHGSEPQRPAFRIILVFVVAALGRFDDHGDVAGLRVLQRQVD